MDLYFLPHNVFNKTRFVRCIYSVVIYDTYQKRNISYRLQFHTCTNNHNSRSHVVSIHASVRREACRTYPISHRSILLARYCTLQCEYTRYVNCLSRYRCETLVPIVSPRRDNTCLYCYVSSSLVVTFCHLAV